MKLLKAFIFISSVFIVFSCSGSSKNNQITKQPLPIACKQMAPVKDIWLLEPMLLKQGKIQEKMAKADKEKVIRLYIRNKNEQYKICLKSSK